MNCGEACGATHDKGAILETCVAHYMGNCSANVGNETNFTMMDWGPLVSLSLFLSLAVLLVQQLLNRLIAPHGTTSHCWTAGGWPLHKKLYGPTITHGRHRFPIPNHSVVLICGSD